MAPPRIPLHEVTAAVQDAVKRALEERGLADIDQLWIGFVAPDNVATLENADKIAKALGSAAHGTPQVGQLTGASAGAAPAARPPRLCGYIHDLR
jgi:hypothetical protein